jgi:hypothetical protein
MNIHPLELGLVLMNFLLIAEVQHELYIHSHQRSNSIEHFVNADKVTNQLVSSCIVARGTHL